MKLEHYFLPDDNEYNCQVMWGINDDENNKSIKQWCDNMFGSSWQDAIEDYHMLYLKNEKDLLLFLLRWS